MGEGSREKTTGNQEISLIAGNYSLASDTNVTKEEQ